MRRAWGKGEKFDKAIEDERQSLQFCRRRPFSRA